MQTLLSDFPNTTQVGCAVKLRAHRNGEHVCNPTPANLTRCLAHVTRQDPEFAWRDKPAHNQLRQMRRRGLASCLHECQRK